MSKPSNDEQKSRTADSEPSEALAPADLGGPGDSGLESGAQPAETLEATETLEKLKARLEAKDREIAELNDKYLRALAEQENSRKRIRQQGEENLRLQRESLLRDLLPILDNLELAVAAARGGGDGESIVAGIEMVLRSLHDLLSGHGVTPQEAVGRSFNPQFHEAIDQLESPEHKPNMVVREYRRGYQIGDRVLRPARVAVAKAPPEQAKAHDDEPRQRRHPEDGGAGKSWPGDVENE